MGNNDTWIGSYSLLKRLIELSSWEPYWFITNLGTQLDGISDEDRWYIVCNLLYEAASIGNADALKIILSVINLCDVDINYPVNKGKTAAYVAAENGHKDCVKLLRRHGAWMNYRVKWRGDFVLSDAAASNGYTL